MSFLEDAINEGLQDANNDKLSLILLGPSGAGKSGTCGTLGVKTLYLYTNGEKHGPISANTFKTSEVLPVCIDRAAGKQLTPDEAYERLLTILNDGKSLKSMGIEAIVLDGATEIENIIVSSTVWKTRVATAYKGVESFAGPVTLSMFRPILQQLAALQRELGIHYVVTCMLSVKEFGDNGVIAEAEPRLKGFDVATGLIQQFDDVLIIGQMSKNGRATPRIQLTGQVSKSTKDFVTKEVRKTLNFTPRLTGVSLQDAPDTLAPDLSRLIAYKHSKKYLKKES